MMLAIPDVLDAEACSRVRAVVDGAEWEDGNATSGFQSALAKRNRQLAEDSPAAKEAGRLVVEALGRSALFITAALPLKIFPPLFNRYEGGEAFGTHVDNAMRSHRESGFRVRSDLSATLFLEAPDAYDGGELVVEDNLGTHAVKLPAGHLLLYPASSLHRVEPVTRACAGRELLLDPVDGPRRCGTDFAVRSRPLDPGDRPRSGAGRPGNDQADGHLPQSASPLGRQLGLTPPRAGFRPPGGRPRPAG